MRQPVVGIAVGGRAHHGPNNSAGEWGHNPLPFPKISELWSEPVTVGPAFYNRWVVPAGLAIFALMGAGPIFGYRKTSTSAMIKGFKWPLIASAIDRAL